MWPTTFALTVLTAAVEARIAALAKQAGESLINDRSATASGESGTTCTPLTGWPCQQQVLPDLGRRPSVQRRRGPVSLASSVPEWVHWRR